MNAQTPRSAPPPRVLAIDALRGLTVLVMILVNEWAGVAGLPDWLKHMPADADAMSFVDMVFPCFLFIVGMSIPLALQARAGQSGAQVLRQLGARTLGLLVLGVFMVNAEAGYLQQAMALPIAAWALLAYLGAFLLWGSVRGGAPLAWGWRAAGVLLLALLAWLYRSAPEGNPGLSPQWWGILGLIGWAYALGCLCQLLSRGHWAGLLLGLCLCLGYYIAAQALPADATPLWRVLLSQGGHAIHAAIVICGLLCTQLFQGAQTQALSETQRQRLLLGLGLALLALAALLRPLYKISKIHATPSWAFYSAGAAVLLFLLLHRLLRQHQRAPAWLAPLMPAAQQPLLAYLLPYVLGAAMLLLHWHWPEPWAAALPGLLRGFVYALLVLWLVKRLARAGLRLRL